jgi:hypothetical protein
MDGRKEEKDGWKKVKHGRKEGKRGGRNEVTNVKPRKEECTEETQGRMGHRGTHINLPSFIQSFPPSFATDYLPRLASHAS